MFMCFYSGQISKGKHTEKEVIKRVETNNIQTVLTNVKGLKKRH